MNVSVIGQGPAGAFAPVRSQGGSPPGGDLDETRAREARQVPREPSRRAWFDMNGDGRIENHNPLYGGDGTVLLPGGDVDRTLQLADREVVQPYQRRAPATPAVVEHARDAYERYAD